MARSVQRAFPLTPLQEGMLFHTILEPDSGLYHGQCAAVLHGPLDAEHFRVAWARIADRHEACRTAFAWERRDRPLQVVLDSVTIPIRFLDWTELEPEQRRVRWEAVIEHDRRQPFDLSKAPVMRMVVAKEDDETHRFLWGVHHALLDGWSAMSVLAEVLGEYDARVSGRSTELTPAPSYAQFVGWLESQDEDAARAYWTERLVGLRDASPLPGVGHGPPTSSRVTSEVRLSVEDTAALTTAAARLHVTLNTLTVAAWSRVLGRHAERSEVLFGVTVTERPAEIPEVGSAAGLYLSTVPIRVRLSPSEPVDAWLQALQRDLSEGRTHGAPGLSKIQRWSRVANGPLITSLVVFESFPDGVGGALRGGVLEVEDLSMTGPSNVPLALLAYPGERLALQLVRDPSALSETEAAGLLDEVADELRSFVSPLRTASADEVYPAQASGAELQREVVDVLTLFERCADADPDAVALSGPSGRLSYGALDRVAEEVAGRIVATGIGSEARVAILAERSAEAIIGLLASLKSGCAYVPIDPGLPPDRVRAMAAAADVVITSKEWAGLAASTGHEVLLVRTDEEAPQSVVRAASRTAPEDAAYAIFTSGSTGTPKAVVVERRQLAWSTAARLEYYRDSPRSFLLLSPFTVDSATAGIYWTLCTGGTLVLPASRVEQDLDQLTRLIGEESVSHTLMVPSLYQMILEHADPERLRGLDAVVLAGEACRVDVLRAHRAALPGVELYNEYGPSEATVWATVDRMTDHHDDSVSIGRPLPSTRVYLLDAAGRDVVAGEAGEIFISGPGVARGYLREPQMTADRFLDDPRRPGERMYRTGDRARWMADGRLDFLGRVDDQIKLRGYRVEPGEIEAVITAHVGVRDALVALTDSGASPSAPLEGEALLAALAAMSEADRTELIERVEVSVD